MMISNPNLIPARLGKLRGQQLLNYQTQMRRRRIGAYVKGNGIECFSFLFYVTNLSYGLLKAPLWDIAMPRGLTVQPGSCDQLSSCSMPLALLTAPCSILSHCCCATKVVLKDVFVYIVQVPLLPGRPQPCSCATVAI